MMKEKYKTFFSFNVDILKDERTKGNNSSLKNDELSFEEIGYLRYQLKYHEFNNLQGVDKENVSKVCQKRTFCNLTNNGDWVKKDIDSRRISILESINNENSELNKVCEVIESLNLNSSQKEQIGISPASSQSSNYTVFKLGSCGNFDKSEEGATFHSEGNYYLVSMFSACKYNSEQDTNKYEKSLFSMGLVSTMNPYHVRSRSFRESIMLNYINERYNNYSKLQTFAIPYMLYQINLASAKNKNDIPSLNQSSFKTGYSFTLEINQGYKRTFMLKKLIGSGANASVFSSDVCTIVNEKLVSVFSCAVKIQHKDLGLNIREIYCGLSLYKRNKKREPDINWKASLEIEKPLISNEYQTNSFNEAIKKGSPLVQKTARSSISTTYLPGSNIPSSRNSLNSFVAPMEILNENHSSENMCRNSLNNLIQASGVGFYVNSTNTPLNNLKRNSVSSVKTASRVSISSNYTCNYMDSSSDRNSLIEPIEIGVGVTVFCITELFIVSQSSSGMIQNILTREMMKGNREQEKKQKNRELNDHNTSVGISILPTFFGSQSLQNILNEHYLKNGATVEEPMLLFLTYQFAETLLALNEMKILHGDIKPDNILLYPNPSFDGECWSNGSNLLTHHPLIPENHELPIFMSIIDFGRSLDIGEVYKNTFFEGNCHAKGFLPPVMLENLPWIHHIDIFGIASTIHCLITGRYMELTKWSDETLKCLEYEHTINKDGDYILKVYNYRIKNQSSCLKRNWKMEFWSSFMANCINFCPILHSRSLPNTNKFQNPLFYNNEVEPTPEQTKSLHVSQSIDEISQNIRFFLKKVQADIVSIFQEDQQLKTTLYKQLLKTRKQLQNISASN
ncbi:Bub1p related protein kinase [Cryptosporidium ubiquitum]|uniref:Bub1p related protein kinase n=1 Tax=Cryptosporidium ubiquitum TaxID=857276 RepID=A0A1J4MII6_9CRYT|nr:Bub1p related protein kinase [Cryptosporidium ubiquitum]OII74074.1 Bub1p related protein kinase [Cryptosporidium ubiquitum]